MLTFYRVIKFSVIGILVLMAIVLSAAYLARNSFDWKALPVIPSMRNNLEKVKKYIFKDSYDHDVLEKAVEFRKGAIIRFDKIYSIAAGIISNNDFYNYIFRYEVSRKMDGMDDFIKNYFSGENSFLDIIISDTNDEIIYKFGTESFTVTNNLLSNSPIIRYADNNITVTERYENADLDINYEITVIFDSARIAEYLKDYGPDDFLIMNGRIYKNSEKLNADLSKINLMEKKVYYEGRQLLDIAPISVNSNYLATIGVFYSRRGLEDKIFMGLKIIIILLFVIFLFFIDRYTEKRLKKLRLREISGSKSTETGAADAQTDASLNWFTKYIEKNEKKND